MSLTISCPCCSGVQFDQCCGPYLNEEKFPSTASGLMRSRYCAYVMENIDYLAKTHAPETKKEFDYDVALEWARSALWQGLTVKKIQGGEKEQDTKGVVEFVAQYEEKGKTHMHHEIAQFIKHADRWYYLDGELVPRTIIARQGEKVGRNDPCPCGSGKKFKKCCVPN